MWATNTSQSQQASYVLSLTLNELRVTVPSGKKEKVLKKISSTKLPQSLYAVINSSYKFKPIAG
jgi:hypothetical protein